MSDTNENYWSDYSGLQDAKHQLLSKYLAGWFPILASAHGRVIYVDCHAGRGSHKTGHKGSPVLALQGLLTHQRRAQILQSTEVRFILFENDLTNCEHLRTEIASLGKPLENIKVDVFPADYEKRLRELVDDMNQRNQSLAPSFAFVDPYGFKLSMQLLNDLLSFPSCELLINFMFRYVDMAIHHPAHASNMDTLFGCQDWRGLVNIENNRERERATIALFSHQLKAEFVTHMHMVGDNSVLKYVLLHASNHPKGRELMKESMWAVVPDGSFTAFERDTPNQLILIEPKPSLEPLKDLLWENFAGRQVHMKEIYEWLLHELYLQKHIRQVLREYRNQKIVNFSDYEGRFAFEKNPLASFPSR